MYALLMFVSFVFFFSFLFIFTGVLLSRFTCLEFIKETEFSESMTFTSIVSIQQQPCTVGGNRKNNR